MGAESMNRARVRRVALHVGLWSITLFEVFELGQAGLRKFTSMDVWWGLFENCGYPFWFLIVIGIAELGGAVLLLVPPSAGLCGGRVDVRNGGKPRNRVLQGSAIRALVPADAHHLVEYHCRSAQSNGPVGTTPRQLEENSENPR